MAHDKRETWGNGQTTVGSREIYSTAHISVSFVYTICSYGRYASISLIKYVSEVMISVLNQVNEYICLICSVMGCASLQLLGIILE